MGIFRLPWGGVLLETSSPPFMSRSPGHLLNFGANEQPRTSGPSARGRSVIHLLVRFSVALVKVGDTLVNEELIRQGLVWVFTGYCDGPICQRALFFDMAVSVNVLP
jgi:hypothetical protein